MPRANIRPIDGEMNKPVTMDGEWLRPWQRKALKRGRTPLPESPGHRPWLPTTHDADFVLVRQPTKAVPRPIPQKKLRSEATGLPKCQWSRSEIQLLLDLRSKKVHWIEMQEYFPNRSIDGIKQAWWKYRLSVIAPGSRLIRLSPKVRVKEEDKENEPVVVGDHKS
ncbi:Fc.00g114730.m01.CDS01 [Cosmosporella sp. VM-42]